LKAALYNFRVSAACVSVLRIALYTFYALGVAAILACLFL
jgi:hypothetical protein